MGAAQVDLPGVGPSRPYGTEWARFPLLPDAPVFSDMAQCIHVPRIVVWRCRLTDPRFRMPCSAASQRDYVSVLQICSLTFALAMLVMPKCGSYTQNHHRVQAKSVVGFPSSQYRSMFHQSHLDSHASHLSRYRSSGSRTALYLRFGMRSYPDLREMPSHRDHSLLNSLTFPSVVQ